MPRARNSIRRRQVHLLALLACLPLLSWAVPNPPVILCEGEDCTLLPQMGAFIDAPVEGLTYSTGSQAGITDANGSFFYLEGETIRFEFGGVEIGEAPAQNILTPLDIIPDSAELQVALMSFLQSLDPDRDLSNGIELTTFSEEQLRNYVAGQLDPTFGSIFARQDYPALVTQLTNRSVWIGGPEALETFNAEIAPLVQQGLYVVPPPAPEPVPEPQPEPQPEPEPGPSDGACPAQPQLNLANILGGPFNDCGPATSSRIPDPTKPQHGFGGGRPGDPTGMNEQTVCVVPGWDYNVQWAFPDLPNLPVHARDQIYYNTSTSVGIITFTGQRVVWNDTNGGQSEGYICGPGAQNVEYNGQCVCP